MISESDLLSATISFDPPLYNKRAKTHQVYLIPRSGSIVKGRVSGIMLCRTMDKVLGRWSIGIDVPVTLAYDNRPEYVMKEFPISDLMRDGLRLRVKEAFEEETDRIAQRPGFVSRVDPSSTASADATPTSGDEQQAELQAAGLSFYPALGIRTRESRDVHLSTASGKIYRGIQIWQGRIKMPTFVILHNRPEIIERHVPLSPSTHKVLTEKIRGRLFDAAAGLL